MATYATDLSTFDLADADTNWGELSGHTTGAAPAETTENFYHNSTAIDQATGQGIGTNTGLECDYGSTLTWTSGWVFMAWQKFDAGTNIYSWASGGMRIGIGSSSGNMSYWNALGDDFRNYPSGGWQNTAIDPETTPDGTDDGTPVADSYRVYGSLLNMRAKISKGSPHVCDAIRFGRGEFQVTGTGATFDGMATADTAATAKWGLFDGKEWKGLMSIGLTATSCTFSDSNKSFAIVDSPAVTSDFNKIEINNASTSMTWTSISISGVQTSITGSAPVAKGNFACIDDATVAKTTCTFTDMGYFTYKSNSTIDTCIYRRCGLVTQGSATITGCTFDEPTGTVGLLVNSLDDIDECVFNSNGTGHAVNLGTISANDTVSWDNTESGYAIQTGTAGDRTILVSVDTGITLTINVATGASTPTYYNTGAGTVSVVSGQVTTLITVKDNNTREVIVGARVFLEEDLSGSGTPTAITYDMSTYNTPTSIFNEVTDSNGEVSDTRSLSVDMKVKGRVRMSTSSPFYKTVKLNETIDKDTGLTVNSSMIRDD